MASDGKDLHTYVHAHTTIRGSMVIPDKHSSLLSFPDAICNVLLARVAGAKDGDLIVIFLGSLFRDEFFVHTS